MKKLLILIAVLAALGASSCAFMFEYEITVENETGHNIDVALSTSRTSPGSFKDIRDNNDAVFTVELDEYYVWVKRDGLSSSFAERSEDSVDVTSDNTLTIDYNGSNYTLSYYE